MLRTFNPKLAEKHIRELLATYKVKDLRKRANLQEPITYDKVGNPSVTFEGGARKPRNYEIEGPLADHVEEYFILLHEIGHIVTGVHTPESAPTMRELFAKELEAHRWAFENTRFELTENALNLAAEALASYWTSDPDCPQVIAFIFGKPEDGKPDIVYFKNLIEGRT